jgi:hypothetical protein
MPLVLVPSPPPQIGWNQIGGGIGSAIVRCNPHVTRTESLVGLCEPGEFVLSSLPLVGMQGRTDPISRLDAFRSQATQDCKRGLPGQVGEALLPIEDALTDGIAMGYHQVPSFGREARAGRHT